MTPREIDALVAEKVMGWEDIGGNFMPPEAAKLAKETGVVIDILWSIPKYTSDSREATEILYKFKHWELGPTPEFSGVICTLLTHSAVGKTTPMAICKAALRAVGVEVPDA